MNEEQENRIISGIDVANSEDSTHRFVLDVGSSEENQNQIQQSTDSNAHNIAINEIDHSIVINRAEEFQSISNAVNSAFGSNISWIHSNSDILNNNHITTIKYNDYCKKSDDFLYRANHYDQEFEELLAETRQLRKDKNLLDAIIQKATECFNSERYIGDSTGEFLSFLNYILKTKQKHKYEVSDTKPDTNKNCSNSTIGTYASN